MDSEVGARRSQGSSVEVEVSVDGFDNPSINSSIVRYDSYCSHKPCGTSKSFTTNKPTTNFHSPHMIFTVGTLSPPSTITIVTTATLPPLRPPGTHTQLSSSQSTSTSPRLPTTPTFYNQQRTSSASDPIKMPSLRTLHYLLVPLSSISIYKSHISCNVLSKHHLPLHRTLSRILLNYPHLF